MEANAYCGICANTRDCPDERMENAKLLQDFPRLKASRMN
jgi:hypothetical protein